jgi:hypothetical protein
MATRLRGDHTACSGMGTSALVKRFVRRVGGAPPVSECFSDAPSVTDASCSASTKQRKGLIPGCFFHSYTESVDNSVSKLLERAPSA